MKRFLTLVITATLSTSILAAGADANKSVTCADSNTNSETTAPCVVAPSANGSLGLSTPLAGDLTVGKAIGLGAAAVAFGIAVSNDGGNGGGGTTGTTGTTGTAR